MRLRLRALAALAGLALVAGFCRWLPAQTPAQTTAAPEKVIFDTDIGDDLDDAFALELALSSPKLQVLGVTTAWGDTDLRARLTARLLSMTGHSDVPVYAGPKTQAKYPFTQAKFAERWPEPQQGWPSAIDFMLDTIRRNPGQVTLVSIAPFSNVGALIDRDPATFKKLRRVVIMGGSIRRGYGDLGFLPDHGPDPEYNILMDIPAAKKLFTAGVPLYVMPLDSTQLKFQEVLRNILFSQGTPVTDALADLYHEWTASTQNPTPTLFDAMAVAYTLNPDLCPTQPMHVVVDDKGFTRVTPGEPNAQVCLHSDPDKFFHFYIDTVLHTAPEQGDAAADAEPDRPSCASECVAQTNYSFIDRSGTAHVTRVVPVPSTVSQEAQKLIGSDFANLPPPGQGKPELPVSPEERLARERAFADATEKRLGSEALAAFPVTVKEEAIAGVPVRLVEPKKADAKAARILINLHGGGFVADWGSLTESIPVASLTHAPVVSVLYRMAPEHPYPAALDDAVAVYRALLRKWKPEQIGIYGTSAGAILTIETASRIRQMKLPMPAALGIFSGSGDLTQLGDSDHLFSLLGLAGPLGANNTPPFPEYVGDANRRDPVLSPVYADLHGFPPTLFLSSTRDALLSDTATLDRAFLRAGVPAQFAVFEGLQHGFWNDPKLPESREADRMIANFFDAHTGGPAGI